MLCLKMKGFLYIKMSRIPGNPMSHGRLVLDSSRKETPESNSVTERFRKGKVLLFRTVNLFLCEEAFPIPALMTSKHDKNFLAR